jgi:conjugative transfer region protein (TIGR03750 family)
VPQKADAMQDSDVLADRVDIEPPIFKGCSSSELLAMLVVAVVVWIPVSLLLSLALGKVAYALAILAVGVIGSVYGSASVFQRVKRNRPDHYYVHVVMRALHRWQLRSFPLAWRTGYWDIGRS